MTKTTPRATAEQIVERLQTECALDAYLVNLADKYIAGDELTQTVALSIFSQIFRNFVSRTKKEIDEKNLKNEAL